MLREVKDITKTSPCNEPRYTPLLYSKTRVYRGIIFFFLFLRQNIDCGYSLGSNVYPNQCFEQKLEKKLSEN